MEVESTVNDSDISNSERALSPKPDPPVEKPHPPIPVDALVDPMKLLFGKERRPSPPPVEEPVAASRTYRLISGSHLKIMGKIGRVSSFLSETKIFRPPVSVLMGNKVVLFPPSLKGSLPLKCGK